MPKPIKKPEPPPAAPKRGMAAIACSKCKRFLSKCECPKAGGEERSDPSLLTTTTSSSSNSPNSLVASTASGASRSTPTSSSPTATAQPARSSLGSKLATKLVEAKQQRASEPPHVVVDAKAGTGKTTTAVEGVKDAKGLKPKITPSEQQVAIWDALKAGKFDTICFGAFGHDIAQELNRRIKECGLDKMRVVAKTMHGIGLYAAKRALGKNAVWRNEEPDEHNVGNIICEILGTNHKALRKAKPVLYQAADAIVGYVKQNLTGSSEEEIRTHARHYDVDVPARGTDDYATMLQLIPEVLERCKSPNGTIDYNDMLWLTCVLNLPIWGNDLMVGDEVQDWNRAQQHIALRSGDRQFLFGDPRQSIFAFAGADSQSMPRMSKLLQDKPNGLATYPLSVTRRCGRAIVEEARRYVSDFSAHPSNPDGSVGHARYTTKRTADGLVDVPYAETYMPRVQDGDMVLCHMNAPLVSQCFKFLALGRKANILGKKIGDGLISLIERYDAPSVPALITALDKWYDQEVAKEQALNVPSDVRLEALHDKRECLLCFTQGAQTVDDVTAKVKAIFSEDRPERGVSFSSGHKAKGLEAKKVFILEPEGTQPRIKNAQQQDQEDNLRYVMITRAIEELTYVS